MIYYRIRTGIVERITATGQSVTKFTKAANDGKLVRLTRKLRGERVSPIIAHRLGQFYADTLGIPLDEAMTLLFEQVPEAEIALIRQRRARRAKKDNPDLTP